MLNVLQAVLESPHSLPTSLNFCCDKRYEAQYQIHTDSRVRNIIVSVSQYV